MHYLNHRRGIREIPSAAVEPPDVLPGPEEALENHVMREWVWQALDSPASGQTRQT